MIGLLLNGAYYVTLFYIIAFLIYFPLQLDFKTDTVRNSAYKLFVIGGILSFLPYMLYSTFDSVRKWVNINLGQGQLALFPILSIYTVFFAVNAMYHFYTKYVVPEGTVAPTVAGATAGLFGATLIFAQNIPFAVLGLHQLLYVLYGTVFGQEKS